MLTEYKGSVTVKIDGIAASAASVIAMAGDKILMSPVSMLMIHNPTTYAFGDHVELQKVMDMLTGVKESIINAYVIKTGLSRAKLSHLMDSETWMDANKAVELGFADDVIQKTENMENEKSTDKKDIISDSMLFSRKAVNNALLNKLEKHYAKPKVAVEKQAEIKEPVNDGTPAKEIMERLEVIKRLV